MNLIGRIMGLDVGDARVGVAVSDELGISAQPHSTLKRNKGDKVLFQQIISLVEELSVQKVILGLPLGLDGLDTEQTAKVRSFALSLEKALSESGQSIPMDFQDERLSSVEAERILVDRKLKDSERRAAVDRMAASILLRGYLDSRI